MKRVLLLALCCAIFGSAEAKRPNRVQEDEEVRNVILMIGDGMGLAQMALFRIEGGYAETAFNRAQQVALIDTRSANNRVTDSAAAGTALATGHKTNNSWLGMTPDTVAVQSLVARATAAGRPTGLVVTCYLQHATPAAFYAHVTYRGKTEEITAQMAESNIDVLLGGGGKWLAAECPDGGTWFDSFKRQGYTVARTMDEVAEVHEGKLLGVVAESHLKTAIKGRGDYLPTAVTKALEILDNNAKKSKKGFMMMVEGSLIDGCAHSNDAAALLEEMEDFNNAINVAMDYADRTPGTLVVVVADHETGGLSMPSGNADFLRSESGVDYKFSTTGHSAIMVPTYLYGAGAKKFAGLMDNTELSNKIAELLGL